MAQFKTGQRIALAERSYLTDRSGSGHQLEAGALGEIMGKAQDADLYTVRFVWRHSTSGTIVDRQFSGIREDMLRTVRGRPRFPGEPQPGGLRIRGESKSNGKPLSTWEAQQLDTTCPACSVGTLIEKQGRYGAFVGCNRYPECSYIAKEGREVPAPAPTPAPAPAPAPVPTPIPAPDMQQPVPVPQDAAQALQAFIQSIAANSINAEKVREIAQEVVTNAIPQIAEIIGSGAPRAITVKVNDLPEVKIEGKAHALLPELVKRAAMKSRKGLRYNIALVGDAGTGKSTLAAQASEVLGLTFGYLNCSGGVSESRLVGRMTPNLQTGTEHYTPTPLVNAYENGGGFCLDEMDALDANVLLTLNGMIENGHWTRPDGVTVTRHPDFILFATMNTYGTGASRMFTGRTQLDGASLDRWMILDVTYDEQLERDLTLTAGLADRVHAARAKMRQLNMRRWLTGRIIERADMLVQQCGYTLDQALHAETASWSEQDRTAVGFPARV
jgi:cobaltochelatase CobS